MSRRSEFKQITADTKRLLAGQEGREVDFKRSYKGDPEDFVAFANSRGGTILVGVDEIQGPNGEQLAQIVGCNITDELKRNLTSKASQCRPAIDIQLQIENSAEKPILRIDVPEGTEKPYCTSGGVYKYRVDGSNTIIDPTMMMGMFLEREADEFITRFRAAGEDLLIRLDKMQQELSLHIEQVRQIADQATQAATQAAFESMEAKDAARDAHFAAEDIQTAFDDLDQPDW